MAKVKIIVRFFLLLIMVLLGLTAIFPGWYHERHIIYKEISYKFLSKDEITSREKAQKKKELQVYIEEQMALSNNTEYKDAVYKMNLRNRAEYYGMPYEKYKEEFETLNSIKAGLEFAIQANDIVKIKLLIGKIAPEQLSSDFIIRTIKEQRPEAFVELYKGSGICYANNDKSLQGSTIKAGHPKYDPIHVEMEVAAAVFKFGSGDILRAWYSAGCAYKIAVVGEGKTKYNFLSEIIEKLYDKKIREVQIELLR